MNLRSRLVCLFAALLAGTAAPPCATTLAAQPDSAQPAQTPTAQTPTAQTPTAQKPTAQKLSESPYEVGWLRDGIIGGGSLVVAVTGSLVNDGVTGLTEQEVASLSRADVNAFDRGATANYSPTVSSVSDVSVGMCMASQLVLMIDGRMRNDAGKLGLMYVETMMLAVFLPSYTKGGAPRIRPFVYHPDAPLSRKLEPEARRSFFSGHTSVAFASAAFLSTVYGDYYPGSPARAWVWLGSMSAAAAVGSMRYFAGAHYPTDILVGALVGTAAGWGVPALHRISSYRMSLLPAFGGSEIGLAMTYRF